MVTKVIGDPPVAFLLRVTQQMSLSSLHFLCPRPRAVHQVVIGLEAPLLAGQGIINGQECSAAAVQSVDVFNDPAVFDMWFEIVAFGFEPVKSFFSRENRKRLARLQHQRQFETGMDQIGRLVDARASA